MSLSINTNRVDVTKQVETEFAQEAVQEENGDARAESRFILMKANQHATFDKLGLADNGHQDYALATAECDAECDADCPCEGTGCDLKCIVEGCGDVSCPCPSKT